MSVCIWAAASWKIEAAKNCPFFRFLQENLGFLTSGNAPIFQIWENILSNLDFKESWKVRITIIPTSGEFPTGSVMM